MELLVSHQLVEAASALILGLAAGFLYDVFRVIRHRANSKVVTVAADFLFWLIVGLLLFAVGVSAGRGRLRVYMTVLAMASAAVYFCTLSRACTFLCGKLVDLIILLVKIITYPLRLFFSALKKIAKIVKKTFQYWRRWYTIGGKSALTRALSADTRRPRKGGPDETQTRRYNYESYRAGTGHLRYSELSKHMAADRNGSRRAKRHSRTDNRTGSRKR